MPPVRAQRFDESVTRVLRTLREAAKLSQKRAADYFGIDRNSLAGWEMGYSQPHKSQRDSLIVYLLDKLQLRKDHATFKQVWNAVMVEMWEWEPLTIEESVAYQVAPPVVVAQGVTPVFSTPPPLIYELVGRGPLLRELRQALFTHHYVALQGIPGVGKTALAVALAHDVQIRRHFSDGILWARLGKNADPLTELIKWGALLGIAPNQIRQPADDVAWSEAIQTALAARQMLLIIDDAWTSQAALYFRVGGAACAHVLTTRTPEIAVHFASTTIVQVIELDETDGLTLLTHLAAGALNSDREGAKRLVESVGGLPLALSLLGNYVHIHALTQSPEGLRSFVEALHQAEIRLQIAQPLAPLEQHPSLPSQAPVSLSAIIAITSEALAEPTQQTLYALSTFPAKPNTFSAEAARTVADTPQTHLDQLVASGLLEQDATHRFMLHQTIADFADLQLTQRETIMARLAHYFVHYVQTHATEYALVDAETKNMAAALTYAEALALHELSIQGGLAYHPYLELRGLYTHSQTYLENAKGLAVQADEQSLASIYLFLGRLAKFRGDRPQAQQLFEEGMSHVDASDEQVKASLLQELGAIYANQGAYEDAAKQYVEAVVIAKKLHDDKRLGALLQNLGVMAANRGDFATASAHFEEGLVLARTRNDTERMCALLQNLGSLAGHQGQLAQENVYLQEALALARQLGFAERLIVILQNLSVRAHRQRAFKQANAYLDEGLQLARQINHQPHICAMLAGLGAMALDERSFEQAHNYLVEALQVAQKINHFEQECDILQNLGSTAENRGDVATAQRYHEQALALATTKQFNHKIPAMLYGLGRIYRQQQDVVRAYETFQEGLERAKNIGAAQLIMMNGYELGMTYVLEKQWAEATSYLEAALHLARELDRKDLIAYALHGLAECAVTQHDVTRAAALASESATLFASLQHPAEAEVRQWIAQTIPSVPL